MLTTKIIKHVKISSLREAVLKLIAILMAVLMCLSLGEWPLTQLGFVKTAHNIGTFKLARKCGSLVWPGFNTGLVLFH